MKYLLDTNILSELLKKRPNPHLIVHLHLKQSESFFTSCICVMELRFGAALRSEAEIFWEKFTEEILSKVTILPIESAKP
jgi:predicted nucleic acid-binding protein